MYLIPKYITTIARNLRKNQTKSEEILWQYIRNNKLGVKFLRQKPIYLFTDSNGAFRFCIPDFYSSEKKLIIEIDGNIHNIPEVLNLDKIKEKYITQKGLHILRITNNEINTSIKNVIIKISKKLNIS